MDADGSPARDHLLGGLNDAQLRAVTTDSAPLAILAGAGSGKTRVLTRRIARRALDGEVDPGHVLAVTFTRKAASELRTRLADLGLPGTVNAGTFHAIAFAQLRQRWQERGVAAPAVLDRKVGFVARIMKASSSTLPLDVVGEIEWAKARMVPAAGYVEAAEAAARRVPLDLHRVATIFARYEEEKLARRMVDFDDLLRMAARDIRADTAYAAARRWHHRHFFVDEFQDVNPLQFELLRAWLGDSVDLCIVGDPNQAIYSWNGADARYLSSFTSYFPGAEVVTLTDNYRSTAQILGVANTVLATNIGRDSAAVPHGAFQLRPNKGDGPLPDVRAYSDERAEARGIARRLRDHRAPGRAWSSMAVLVRTNAQLPIIEEALRTLHVPFRSRAGGRLLDQAEVRDALSGLRRGPGRLTERLDELEATLASPVETAASTTAPGLTEERAANVAELVRLGREYLGLDTGGSASDFEGWLRSTSRSDDGLGDGDAVDLATFHSAKGLEWPIVFLAGLEEGLVPIHYAQTPDSRDEERRLLYVGLTRAERELHCSWAEQRTFASRTLPRRPSAYLEPIALALELLSDGRGPVDLAAAVGAQRAALKTEQRPSRTRRPAGPAADLEPADQALLDSLKAWRLQQARASEVPAYVVFNDSTLVEVARRRPASTAQLLDVPGIGAVKAQRFGEQLLRLVAEAPGFTARRDAPAARRVGRGSGPGRAR